MEALIVLSILLGIPVIILILVFIIAHNGGAGGKF